MSGNCFRTPATDIMSTKTLHISSDASSASPSSRGNRPGLQAVEAATCDFALEDRSVGRHGSHDAGGRIRARACRAEQGRYRYDSFDESFDHQMRRHRGVRWESTTVAGCILWMPFRCCIRRSRLSPRCCGDGAISSCAAISSTPRSSNASVACAVSFTPPTNTPGSGLRRWPTSSSGTCARSGTRSSPPSAITRWRCACSVRMYRIHLRVGPGMRAAIRHASESGLLRLEHRAPRARQRVEAVQACLHQTGVAGVVRPRGRRGRADSGVRT